MNASRPAPAAQLDAKALAALRELDPDGRNNVLLRVLGTFDSSLSRMLPALAGARGGGDTKLVADIAHTLKSSAGYVGAADLARVCADVERRLRAGEAGDLDADIDRLLAQAAVAQQLVRAMLPA